jgi:hypothetical protein
VVDGEECEGGGGLEEAWLSGFLKSPPPRVVASPVIAMPMCAGGSGLGGGDRTDSTVPELDAANLAEACGEFNNLTGRCCSCCCGRWRSAGGRRVRQTLESAVQDRSVQNVTRLSLGRVAV